MSVEVLRNPANMDDEGWARVYNAICHLKDLDVSDGRRVESHSRRKFAHCRTGTSRKIHAISNMVDYLGLIEPKAGRKMTGHSSHLLKFEGDGQRPEDSSYLSQPASRDVENGQTN